MTNAKLEVLYQQRHDAIARLCHAWVDTCVETGPIARLTKNWIKPSTLSRLSMQQSVATRNLEE